MRWLALLFALEAGWVPIGAVYLWDGAYESLTDCGYVQMEAEVVALEHAFAGGSIRTVFGPEGRLARNFTPVHDEYLFRLGLRWPGLEVGFRHFCAHPVIPLAAFSFHGRSADAGYEEVYLRISGAVGVSQNAGW